ncbi:MAG TPA: ATP-dependent zinc metalloprotease FtsH [Ruminococcaceae bacterium]|nr:ATP-dependent zinc metalloprotease FtsH [Oscillospiraceae bacterium]
MNNMAKNWKSILIYLLIPVLLVVSILFLANQQSKTEAKYSEIVSMFENGEIAEFTLDLSSGNLSYKTFKDVEKDKDKAKFQQYSVPNVSLFLDDIKDDIDNFNNDAKNKNNKIVYDYKKGVSNNMFFSMVPTILMFVVIAGLGIFAFRKMSKEMNNETNRTLSFGRIRAKNLTDDEGRKTTFADVAGCDEEKEELVELVDFLKDPDKFTQLGARIPKGVLLVGPPGTGKTLLARAVAGEAGVPFLSISGSDFVEMYVGVGASRVRDLFDQAKKKSPAIVFIDEIDAVGRQRGSGLGNGNDEREQTLNQLLVEMDGFGTNEGVIVIAATNRPDVLDSAILRPGRFDRQVTVGRPDTKGREEILKVHSKNKPLAPDVDLKSVAKSTIGFVGADLENLMNEAALLAARRGYKAITYAEIQEAMVKVRMGAEKKSHKYSEKALKLTAFHEAGHAVVAYFLDNHDPVEEISIIPRGMGAGGYTMYQPQEENYNSKNEMLDFVVSALGGRVAEALVMDDVSTGASNDIEHATNTVREMVMRYGMSDVIGPINYSGDNQEVFVGRDYGKVKNYSEETAAKIDEEVTRIINDAYNRTKDILTENMDKLKLVAVTLMEREKLDKDEFVQLMENGFIEEKEEKAVVKAEDDVQNASVTDDAETVSAQPEENADNQSQTDSNSDSENNE